MTHLPFVTTAYALTVLLPIVFGLDAWRRTVSARRRLAAIDPRQTGRSESHRANPDAGDPIRSGP